jgi:hypothetical protein
MSDDAATPSDDQAQERSEGAAEDTKRKFREALAAKQGRQGEDHLDGHGKAGGQAHGQLSGKRTFRRKTG